MFFKSYVWKIGYDQYGKIQWKFEVLEIIVFATILMDFGTIFME
jgi:hypothetical protein